MPCVANERLIISEKEQRGQVGDVWIPAVKCQGSKQTCTRAHKAERKNQGERNMSILLRADVP